MTLNCRTGSEQLISYSSVWAKKVQQDMEDPKPRSLEWQSKRVFSQIEHRRLAVELGPANKDQQRSCNYSTVENTTKKSTLNDFGGKCMAIKRLSRQDLPKKTYVGDLQKGSRAERSCRLLYRVVGKISWERMVRESRLQLEEITAPVRDLWDQLV